MNVSIEIANKQHRHLVSTLEEQGVEVIMLEPFKQFPEQVFTRDVGCVIGEQLLLSRMSNFLRKGEEKQLEVWCQTNGISYVSIEHGFLEGGDVLIDGEIIYVGLSNRTNKDAAASLKKLFPDFEVMEIPFTDAYLHLDCVFNILSPNEAVIYPEEIHGDKVARLKKQYELIPVTKEEQASLATNILSIGEKRIVSLPENTSLNQELRRRGYEVIEVDLTEIIKFGGSFRCCTLPLIRE